MASREPTPSRPTYRSPFRLRSRTTLAERPTRRSQIDATPTLAERRDSDARGAALGEEEPCALSLSKGVRLEAFLRNADDISGLRAQCSSQLRAAGWPVGAHSRCSTP